MTSPAPPAIQTAHSWTPETRSAYAAGAAAERKRIRRLGELAKRILYAMPPPPSPPLNDVRRHWADQIDALLGEAPAAPGSQDGAR